MTKYLLLICTAVILGVSCDRTAVCSTDELTPLDGYHSLTSISCECPFNEINPFQQQWEFDFDKSEIEVFTGCDVGSDLILDPGTYDFELIDTLTWGSDVVLLKVNNRDFYLDVSDDRIQLSDLGAAFDAGSYYEFVEN